MENSLILVVGIIIAFLVGLFTSRKTSSTDAKILDLTGKIKDNQARSAQAQALADKAVKEYEDAKKKYDDNPDKPSA